MMLPTRPVTHLIVRQPGFALASLEAFFDAMFGFGHPSTCPQRCLRPSIGQIIIHFDHLLVVSITVAEHHHHLFIALLAPMSPGHDTSLDRLDSQRAFGTIAHVDAAPGLLPKRLAPGRDVLPGTCGPTPPTARGRGLDLQITYRRVRRHRHQVALSQGRQPTPKPLGAPHLIVTGHPAMRQPGTMVRQHLQGQLVTRAVASHRLRNASFVETGLILGPCFGQGQPRVHEGMTFAGHQQFPLSLQAQ